MQLSYMLFFHFSQQYTIIRNPKKIDEFKTSVTFQLYREFIANVLENIYHKKYHFQKLGLMISEMETELSSQFPRLYEDFFSTENMITLTSLSELIDKISQGDILNAFCFSLLTFNFPLNLRLSPITLAISFDSYKKLQLKEEAENTYKKSALPKLTYICFNGIYSQLDIYMIYEYSDNVQVIMIYDQSTGGPIVEQRTPDNSVSEAENDPKSFESLAKISKNILLIPLDCSAGKIDSKSIYDLFTNTINRAVRAFEPETVLIAHSFTFHPDEPYNQTKANPIPFSLKTSTWTKILYDLCLIANYKVLVYPSKLCYDPSTRNDTADGENSWKMTKNDEETALTFSQSWNPSYFENCIIGTLEALSGIQTSIKLYLNALKGQQTFKPIRKRQGDIMKFTHPIQKQFNAILSQYSQTNLYGRLYSNEMEEALALNKKLQNDRIVSMEDFIRKNPSLNCTLSIQKPWFANNLYFDVDEMKKPFREQHNRFEKPKTVNKIREIHRSHVSNEILVFDQKKLEANSVGNIVSCTRKLSLMYDENTPIFPRKESQYIVDYASSTLYYFNILFENKYRAFEFKIDPNSNLSLPNTQDDRFTRNYPAQGENTIFNLGLCVGDSKVFCVYGKTSDSQCTEQISYFDAQTREWITPKIKHRYDYSEQEEKFIPRHSVTCNYFKATTLYNTKHILYVFGGLSDSIDPTKKWRIWNHVEFYTMNFVSQTFEFRSVSRKQLFTERVSFMPYTHSYSLQMEGQILILGGQRTSNSVVEASSVSNFCYNVEKDCFAKSGKAEFRGSRKSIAPKRARHELAIADASRNIFHDGDNYYIISRCSRSEHLISKISGDATNPIVETFPCLSLNTTLKLGTGTDNSQVTATNTSGWEEEDTRAFYEFVSIYQNEAPEVQALLYYLTKYIQAVFEKKTSNFSSDIFFDALYRIFSDPLFKEGPLKSLIQPLCQIFPMLSQDSRMKTLLSGTSQISGSQNKEIIRKIILKNRSKTKLLQIMKTQVHELVSQGALKIQTVLDLERVFQRNKALQEYHTPEYNQLTVKWFCRDFREFVFHQGKTTNIKDYSHEDFGILRDIIECLGKLLVHVKRNGSKQRLNIEDTDKEFFWNDSDQDLLSSSHSQRKINASNSNENLILDFEENEITESDIAAVLTKVLTELAKREKIEFEEIIEMKGENPIEDKYIKWRQLAQNHPHIFIDVSNQFGITVSKEQISHLSSRALISDKSTTLPISEPNSTYVHESVVEKINRPHGDKLLLELEEESVILENSNVSANRKRRTKHNHPGKNNSHEELEEKLVIEKAKIPLRAKKPVNYHCNSNLEESYKSVEMNQCKIFLHSAGSHIMCKNLENQLTSAKIMIYHPNHDYIEPLFLETHQRSSLAIWNASAFLYLDTHMVRRLASAFKNLENCIFYTDLRQSCLQGGKTKGLAVFYPLFKTTNRISQRAVIADKDGIYLIGGSKISCGKKRNLLLSNDCDYYELDVVLKELSAEDDGQEEEKKQKPIPKLDGSMPSMSLSRAELTITQTDLRIFVANRTTWDSPNGILIEVFDKELFCWMKIIKVPVIRSPFCTYQLMSLEREEGVQQIVILGNEFGTNPIGYEIKKDTKEFSELKEAEIEEIVRESIR